MVVEIKLQSSFICDSFLTLPLHLVNSELTDIKRDPHVEAELQVEPAVTAIDVSVPKGGLLVGG